MRDEEKVMELYKKVEEVESKMVVANRRYQEATKAFLSAIEKEKDKEAYILASGNPVKNRYLECEKEVSDLSKQLTKLKKMYKAENSKK